MSRKQILLPLIAALAIPGASRSEEPRSVSGIYPHLAMFNGEGECGTGAVVPWAERLWVITYGPHLPKGSSDKLYEITPALEQIIRPESIGGTPANRMIHRESGQLFIGPYAIDLKRNVRAIPYTKMYGRHTGLARHLTAPTKKIVFATMEEGIYEVDVATLDVKELWQDEQQKGGRKADLPGYHGKGFYSSQGRYIYANNGERGKDALHNPNTPSGVLAEWDGKADRWTVIRRNQFTDVTGPGGIEGSDPNAPVWSVGWDNRSLILMLLDGGKWTSFRLPKATHSYDGAHGWNTEWPRIRDINEDSLLMTMHGSFWKFPRNFSTGKTGGIAPRSTYVKVVGDFARWNNRLVLGTDDTARSEFINVDSIKGKIASPGVSQSNLWFIDPEQLDQFGPPLGRGAVWLHDDVKSGTPSEPFLFSGFSKRSLHLAHDSSSPVTFTLEVDKQGDGTWTKLREVNVPANGNAWTEFTPKETGAWVRLVPGSDAAKVTAFFHYRADDTRKAKSSPIANGLPTTQDTQVRGALLQTRPASAKTLRTLSIGKDGTEALYDLDEKLQFQKVENAKAGADNIAWMKANVGIRQPAITADAASALYVDGQGRRWRLPKGDPAFDKAGPLGTERLCREVSTERNLLNAYGTFYELPAENAGGFPKLRPISTHNRRIHDFASYRGMLVISGVVDGANSDHIVRSEDGQCAVWVGALDDLWSFGKPRGKGGPWLDTPVKANVPSDSYLATGFDRKSLTLKNSGNETVNFRVEADFSGDGTWSQVTMLSADAGSEVKHKFPDAFGAYWLRVVADKDTTASATFLYE